MSDICKYQPYIKYSKYDKYNSFIIHIDWSLSSLKLILKNWADDKNRAKLCSGGMF